MVLTLLPSAIAMALSPVAIIELILVLFSQRARINGMVFLATLIAGVFLIPVIGAFAVSVATDDSTDQPSTVKGWIILIIGLLLLLVAIRNWRNRADPTVPAVFDSIAKMGPGAVFVLALGATLFNPKNLIVLLSAGTQAGASGESTTTIIVSLVVFTLLATSPFIVSVGYVLVGGETAKTRLDAVREWLMANNRLIMAIVLGALALVLLAQGWAAITA
jgi:hypothetical protein